MDSRQTHRRHPAQPDSEIPPVITVATESAIAAAFTDPPPIQCPACGSVDVERHFGGERGEVGPFLFCGECGYDEEAEAKNAAIQEATQIEEPAPRQIATDEDPNPWRPISDAPKDRIIEGRFLNPKEPARPVRWRSSRRRVGHRWEMNGVWHAAETAGAVQLKPIEWREWLPAGLHFQPARAAVS